MNLLWILSLSLFAQEPKIAPAPVAELVAEEAPARDSAHFPKHRFSVSAQPRSLAGTHSVRGDDFSFHGAGVGYGLTYEYHPSARLAFNADYQHVDLRVESEQGGTNALEGSRSAFDNFELSGRYCFFGVSNFFQQICPGFDLGHESFAALIPRANALYEIGRVYDFVGGLNLSYQSPVSDQIVFRAIAGYGFGSGLAHAGALAPRSDSRYYLRLGGRWEPLLNHAVGVDVEWVNRSITVRDRSSDGLETTKSNDLGLRLTYAYTFGK